MNYKDELNKLGILLVKNRHTVAIAESVTSGLIQNVFSNLENASMFYEGGITAYNIRQKSTHLFVDPVHAIGTNCVSETIAQEMALGVSRSFKTNWGIAITGYASPIPEMGINELYACYAISFDHKIVRCSTIMINREEPEVAQHFYMTTVVRNFVDCCLKFESGEGFNETVNSNK